MLDFEKYIRSGGTKMPARIAATGGTGTAAAARKPPGRKPSAAGADTGAGSPSSSMRTTTGRRKPVGRRSTAATGSGGANAGRGTKSTAGTDLEDESMADSDEDFAALQRPYRSTRGGGASADGDGALILDEGMMDGNALYEEAVEFEDVLNVRTGLLKEKDEKVVGDVAAFIAALDANAPAGPRRSWSLC